MFALTLNNPWQTDLPTPTKIGVFLTLNALRHARNQKLWEAVSITYKAAQLTASQPSAVGGCITELHARSSGGSEPDAWQLPGHAGLLTALLGNTQQKDHHVKHDDFTFLLVPSLQIISFMCKHCSRVPNSLDFQRWAAPAVPEQRQPPNALPGMDDSSTAATFSAHGLNPSKILPALPPATPWGALPAQHLPEPRVLGAPYRRPPPGAARPPRSLSAAAQPASAARRLPRPHGRTAARYRGRAPAAGRAPAPTDDASPEAGDAKTAAEPPPPAAPPPLPRSASPQRRRAAVPQHPAPGRQRLLSALPPFGGGGGPRSHPIPGRKRRARAAEGAGRRGGLRVRVLRCDAAGWRFWVAVPKPGEVRDQPPWAVGGVFPRGRPTAHRRTAAEKQGLLLIEMAAEPVRTVVGVQHALWKYSVVCFSQYWLSGHHLEYLGTTWMGESWEFLTLNRIVSNFIKLMDAALTIHHLKKLQ